MSDPASKYANKVSPEHKMAMEAVGFAYNFLKPHREQLELVLKSERDMHNFGGMIDPTLYRDMLQSKSFEVQIRLIKSAVTFIKEVGEIADQLGPHRSDLCVVPEIDGRPRRGGSALEPGEISTFLANGADR